MPSAFKRDRGSNEWTQLSEYIDGLLKDGKTSKHEDFQVLFRVFGKEKIVGIWKEIQEKEKKEEQDVSEK